MSHITYLGYEEELMINNKQITVLDYVERLKKFFETSKKTSFKSDTDFWYVKGVDNVTDEDKKLTENIGGLYEIVREYAIEHDICDASKDTFEYFMEYSTSEYIIDLGDNVVIALLKVYQKKTNTNGEPYEHLIGFNCTKLDVNMYGPYITSVLNINDILKVKDKSTQKVMKYR